MSTEPIDLSVNAELLQPYLMAMATVGLDVTSDEPEMINACLLYLGDRAGIPDPQCVRILLALRELAEMT